MLTDVAPKVGIPVVAADETYGLRRHILSPVETLAQSVSTIAPSTSPTLTIPLVFALAGQGTWLAYVLALVGVVLISLCVAVFARESSSPGSLYTYTRANLPPWCAAIGAWALFFAYAMTAASLLAGFLNYSSVFLGVFNRNVPQSALLLLAVAAVVTIAHRDIKVSTQLMLWIEAASMCLILVVLAAILWRHGMHVDRAQLTLHGTSASGVRLGVILAIFSFVGFESATTLGTEAREPLRTIPRAVVQSALLAGTFFLLCVYGEVVGYSALGQDLGESTAPMRSLAASAHLRVLGPMIDAGALISMFAGTLACVIAASRVLLMMAQDGMAHSRLGRVHARNATPGVAGLFAGLVAAAPVVVLTERGVSPADVYGWMGTLSVYGFLTAYGLIAVALPLHLRRRGELSGGKLVLAAAAGGATVLAMLGSIFPVPPTPYRYFPYLYLVYLGVGLGWYGWKSRGREVFEEA